MLFFHRQTMQQCDELFKSNRSWLWKLFGAAVVGLVIDVSIIESGDNQPLSMLIVEMIAIPTIIVLIAGIFIRADLVHRRVNQGMSVDPVSRLLFNAGGWTMLVWSAVLISAI